MRQFIDRGVLVSWFGLLRAGTRGAIWLADDDEEARYYEQCAHAEARVLSTHGEALNFLDDVRTRGIRGVVAAVRGAPAVHTDEGVFQPDVGDAASLALRSGTLQQVLTEVAGPAWWHATVTEIGSLTERVVSIAWQWERVLEAAGHTGEWSQDPIKDAVDWTTLTFREEFAADRLGSNAGQTLKAIASLESECDVDRKLREIDGRNAIRLVAEAAALYTPLGLQPRQHIDVATLVLRLNAAFDAETLETDPVFWRMRRWERRNRRFPLLKTWRIMDAFGLVWDQRYWRSDLEALLRLQPPEALAAFKMDLDNFKRVNSELGHKGGDDAIKEYLRAVQGCMGGAAEVYRRGGDEVVAFAPGATLPQAYELAKRLRGNIEDRFRDWGAAQGLKVYPTVSIGVVEVSPAMDVDQVEQLMERAQAQAKKDGKNCVVTIPA